MPFKSKTEQKIYLRGYKAGIRVNAAKAVTAIARTRKAQFLRHQEQLEQQRAKRTAANRKAGHKERAKGPKAHWEIAVPAGRKWRIFVEDGEARIYFTSKRGFTPAELREILRAVTAAGQ